MICKYCHLPIAGPDSDTTIIEQCQCTEVVGTKQRVSAEQLESRGRRFGKLRAVAPLEKQSWRAEHGDPDYKPGMTGEEQLRQDLEEAIKNGDRILLIWAEEVDGASYCTTSKVRQGSKYAWSSFLACCLGVLHKYLREHVEGP